LDSLDYGNKAGIRFFLEERGHPGQVILAMNEESHTRLLRFSLSSLDFGQMMDGLCARQEAWVKTAAWHRGELYDPHFPVEESADEDEAQTIADHYSAILETLREQARDQRG
jgi:hypothetical protein